MMPTLQQWIRSLLAIGCGYLVFCQVTYASGASPKPQLNARGEQIRAEYARLLDSLSQEIVTKLPMLDSANRTTFKDNRATLAALKAPGADAPPQAQQAFRAQQTAAETQVLEAARAILAEVRPFLTSDALDAKLMQIAILRHGTPAGLAEFAQRSAQHKKLVDNLLSDEVLMRQVLAAGGANGGEYGEAMEVYAAILKSSQRAGESGSIFQRLALGTALHQPWLDYDNKGSVNGVVFTDHKNPDGQVARYLHYEQAYLAEELDPAFKDFNAWECRFITNDPYSNEELTWARKMLRNFRPDHITNPDHAWRYVGMVKSDFPYCSTRHDPSLGLPQQEALALGGICGRRAFFGRFITRSFGIPARRSTQTGHAAMNMWTPGGWVVRLGAWWSMNWCGPQGGLDFLLDSQAREFPEYAEVLRAQWVADALGEEDVSLRHYGRGGGFWNGLAFYRKRAMVEDHETDAVGEELAGLTEDEARLLGESDKILGDEGTQKIKIPAEFTKVKVAEDGTLTIPAVACSRPTNNTDKVAFLASWNQGMQLHYQRLGNRPEILRYTVEVPATGKYELTLNVCTVSPKYEVIARLNRRTLVNAMLPYTKGSWQRTAPKTIELRKGRNSIQLTFRAPNRGVSIKEFQLRPVK